MTASDLPLEPLAKPAPDLSLLGRWRWNFLAALFAALLLVALTLRRWRRAEVIESGAAVDRIEHGVGWLPSVRGGALAIVLASSLLTVVLVLFPLAGDPSGSAAMAADSGAVIESVDGFSGEAGAELKCAQCGVVESIREIAQRPEQSTRGVEVTVRMKDGASHLFVATSSENAANSSGWRAGERVIFIDGRRLAGE